MSQSQFSYIRDNAVHVAKSTSLLLWGQKVERYLADGSRMSWDWDDRVSFLIVERR